MNPHVLVAAPTFDGKAYSLPAYLDAYRALDWSGERSLLLVDNSDDGGAYERHVRSLLREGEAVTHVDREGDLFTTLARSWMAAVGYAMSHWIDWVWSLEQDVIVPPGALTTLHGIARDMHVSLVDHAVPSRTQPDMALGESLGCCLFTTRRAYQCMTAPLASVPMAQAWDWLGFESAVHVDGWKVCTDGHFPVRHLAGETDYWPFGGPDLRLRVINGGAA